MREAGHNVRGTDSTAQAKRPQAVYDGERFLRRFGAIVHAGQKVAVRIYPTTHERADRKSTLEETKHRLLTPFTGLLSINDYFLPTFCGIPVAVVTVAISVVVVTAGAEIHSIEHIGHIG